MKIIYGPKGTGKTKIIIDDANSIIESAKGHVVFITDTNRYMYDLKYQIRFLEVGKFDIKGEDLLRGFIKGIVAANADNEYIFIDGVARITGKNLNDLEEFFTAIEKLENEFSVNFIFTCSADLADLPAFIKKHIN